MNAGRLEISRLYQRFAFGPRPGEFTAALKAGPAQTRNALLTPPAQDIGAQSVQPPVLTDLGQRPKPNTPELADFALGMRTQREALMLWWLDLMVKSDHGLTERMVWFWHGHWATSMSKVDHPLAMYKQNQTFRTHALGDLAAMSRAMLNDGALQFWLDGQTNTKGKPNENLAREFMELFLLGVNRYTEDDVKALSKSFTGYQLTSSTGEVRFNEKRHDFAPVTLLGTNRHFSGEEASDYLVAKSDCQKFIAERIWYRFLSSTETMPNNFSAVSAYSSRNMLSAITAAASDPEMQKVKNQMAKAPLEWFIAACRALELTPSQLKRPAQISAHLSKLGQIPFNPPNVGGWPAGEAWLSSASAQYRIEFATWLVKQSSLRALNEIPVEKRVVQSADWFGVAQWSPRTQAALRSSVNDPTEFTVLALTSPEYVVSA
jgi:uncharacterized protein (DUF1800 family)